MKNIKYLLLLSIVVWFGCSKSEPEPSVAYPALLPEEVGNNLGVYIYAIGSSTLYSDLPDTIGILRDTFYGMVGGFGGYTGNDSVYLLKDEILGFPDTTKVGGYTLAWEKFNNRGYKTVLSANAVIAGPIMNFGPSALEGSWKRVSNGFVIQIKKLFDGVYLMDNPGGANVAPFPYLLYNYKNASGKDSIAFPIQPNECGGGTQLVGPGSAPGSKASTYAVNFPPEISLVPPLTMKWKVYTYTTASANAIAPASGQCTWGNTAVRVFEKQ